MPPFWTVIAQCRLLDSGIVWAMPGVSVIEFGSATTETRLSPTGAPWPDDSVPTRRNGLSRRAAPEAST